MDKESKKLEHKEELTARYIKTVCAFSNYDGEIPSGVSNDGKIKPIHGSQEFSLSLDQRFYLAKTGFPYFSECGRNHNTSCRKRNGYTLSIIRQPLRYLL